MSKDGYDAAAAATVETATAVYDALQAYPSLLARRAAGDHSVPDDALTLARGLAAIGRSLVLGRDEIDAGVDPSFAPQRAGLVMLRLSSALVALAREPWDERAQLAPDELDEMVDENGLGDWVLEIVNAVRANEAAG